MKSEPTMFRRRPESRVSRVAWAERLTRWVMFPLIVAWLVPASGCLAGYPESDAGCVTPTASPTCDAPVRCSDDSQCAYAAAQGCCGPGVAAFCRQTDFVCSCGCSSGSTCASGCCSRNSVGGQSVCDWSSCCGSTASDQCSAGGDPPTFCRTPPVARDAGVTRTCPIGQLEVNWNTVGVRCSDVCSVDSQCASACCASLTSGERACSPTSDQNSYRCVSTASGTCPAGTYRLVAGGPCVQQPRSCADGSIVCSCPQTHGAWCHPECEYPRNCGGGVNPRYPCSR